MILQPLGVVEAGVPRAGIGALSAVFVQQPRNLVVVAAGLVLSSPANAQSSSCADAVTGAPQDPATVSATSTAHGRALLVGSGPYTRCSLYLLTSDQLHALTGAPLACSDNLNPLGTANPGDTVFWPALLTQGAPVAGPGVQPKLLGTVTRTDLPGLPAVQQVTYAGASVVPVLPGRRAGRTEGANLDGPVTSPAGVWYLVNPRGLPAPGQAQLQLETAPLGGTGPAETVLAARMNNDFHIFSNVSFPVYTLNLDNGDQSADARSREMGGKSPGRA